MPCWTITEATLDLGKVDPTLLKQAMTALGVSQYTYNGQTVTTQQRNAPTVDKIKQAYGAEIVKQQAKKFGWKLTEVSPFKYQVQR